MNPYGNFFGVPQSYYGAIPPTYPTYVPPNLMGYAPVSTAATTVTVAQPPTTQTLKTETTATVVTQVIVTQDKTPVTTVFVGNIPDRAPDSVIKALLMRCGNILSWKRVQGASGNYQAFGFCEYQSPESTLRCVRLLNNFEILEKKLMVKVDAKTEELLKEYQKKSKGGVDGEKLTDEEDQDDEVVKTALQNILKEAIDTYQLGHESPNRTEYLEGPRHLTIDDLDIDGERKDLINKEIETFRRRNEKEMPAEDRNKRTRDLDFYTSRYSSSSRTAATTRSDRDSERGGGSRYSRSRSPSREPLKKRPRGGITSSSLVSDKHYRSSRSVDEEEEAIKKRLERKLKEKEESYQSRLRQWEARERKKQNEYERDSERDKKKQEYMQSEAKNLLEFLTAYDDDIEDSKYYKGSALQRRLTDREVEETADERDRQKEHEQLEAIRKKLLEEENPEVETIILQMEQAMQEHLQKRLNLDPKSSQSSSSVSRDVSPEPHSIDIPKVSSSGFRPVSPESESGVAESASLGETNRGDLPRRDSSTFLFSMSSKTNDNVIKPAAAFDDDEVETKSKRPVLSFVPPSASEKVSTSRLSSNYPDPKAVANLSVAEKKAIIKQIIERIPTNMEELFTYPIDWRAVDSDLVGERIKPWVDKKIVEYLGEPEATLSKFICEQLLEHKPPAKMLSDIALVLEEEAEIFVAKMWRLLIYAIAEKNLGLMLEAAYMRIRRLVRLTMSMFFNMREHYSRLSTNTTSNSHHEFSVSCCSSRFSFYRGLFAQHVPPLTCLLFACLLISLPEEDRLKVYSVTVVLMLMFFVSLVYFLETFFTFAPNIPNKSRFYVEMPQDSQFPKWRVVKLKSPSLGSGGEVTLKSFLILQEDPAKRATAPTILFIHGNAGNIGHRLPMAKILYDACGANVFLLEYRGFGYSTGQTNEAGICADAKVALDYLASGADGDINGQNIFVFGRSLGGAVVIDLCTQPGLSAHVRGIILENTFTSIPGMGRAIFCNVFGSIGRFLLPTAFVHNRFNSLKKFSKYTLDEDLKFLFISGSKDELVPPRMMKQLATAWAINLGKTSEPDEAWNFESPQAFIDRGIEGIVHFESGNHGTTWMCDGFNDVINHFLSLHQTPLSANK